VAIADWREALGVNTPEQLAEAEFHHCAEVVLAV